MSTCNWALSGSEFFISSKRTVAREVFFSSKSANARLYATSKSVASASAGGLEIGGAGTLVAVIAGLIVSV